MAGELVVLQRVDLYERVWAEPILTIAPRFGISGVYLAKICRSMGIPVPGRGYWARVKAGRTPQRPKLPAPKPNEPTELRFQLRDEDRGNFGDEVKAALAAEKDPEWRVTVSETLSRPHQLVRDSEPLLRRASAKGGGVPVQDRACLDVDASSAVLQRALRIMDALLAFPMLLLALALATALGPSLSNVIVALAMPIVPRAARIARASTLVLKTTAFIEAARATGCSDLRIILRHILPNAFAPLLVIATAYLGLAIVQEAALDYLGAGIQEPQPSWGLMMSGSATSLALVAPWIVIFPGIAICLAVLASNLLGDAIRDLLDPKLKSNFV